MSLESKVIKLTNDLMFKRVFINKFAFIELVCGILEIDDIKEDNVEFLNPEQINEYGQKGIEFDIVAKVTINGQTKKILINVEMQNIVNKALGRRATTYASFLDVISLDKGEDYNFSDVECIWLLPSDDKELFIGAENIKDTYVYTRKNGQIIENSPRIHFVNLQKLKYSGSIFLQEIQNLFFVKDLNKNQNYTSESAKKVARMVMDFNNKEQFVLEALRYEKEVRQRLTEVNDARAEGKAEGLAEGLAEGKINIAKSMLDEGCPLELIAKCTGLSIKEVEKLKSEL